MAERQTISQRVQFGLEATPGTAVAANKVFSGVGITTSVQGETDEFKPTGQKYAALVVPNREWTEFGIEGKPTYDELAYLFRCFFGAPVTTEVETDVAWSHVWTPSSTAADAIKTMTIEQGDAVRAHKFAYALIKDLGIAFSRSAIDLSGGGLGLPITDGITMTNAPTEIPLVPLLPSKLDFYLDETSGAIGTTKLLRTMAIEWSLTDKVDAAWFVNSAINGYAAHIETDPSNELTLTAEADATGMSFLTQLRAGTTRFLRIACTGPLIDPEGEENYSAYFDFAVKVSAGSDLGDQDGVFGSEWPLTVVHDATWGKAMQFTLVNSVETIS